MSQDLSSRKNPKGDPTIALSSCGSTGKVSLNFNHIMALPEGDLDYGQMMQLSIVSALDGSEVVGWYRPHSGARRRLSLENCQDCDASSKQFEWSVIQHSASNLDIKIEFDNQKSVSSTSYGEDQLWFQILQPALFLSQETFQEAIPLV